MKKIILLGGSTQQIPVIKYAKKQGYYTILCDYLEDNPGKQFADKFYCVSTTDKEAILKVAIDNSIDGIVAYASDPAAATAAYVGNKLNLPSNPYKSVEILSKKDLFRKFLRENGFNCPKAQSFSNYNDAKNNIDKFKFPIIIKPIDSSGSKGITCIKNSDELEDAFFKAMENSRERTVIIEEFIEMGDKYIIGGDGFVVNGRLEFCGILNCHRNYKVNKLIPIGKSYPILLDEEKINKVKTEIQKVLDILELKNGALNLELMFDTEGKLYIIEIGPRNGGNMIPELLQFATGVDLIGATVESALGNENILLEYKDTKEYYSTYVIHSSEDGILDDIIFESEIKDNVINRVIYKQRGDRVEKFDGSNKALGIVFLKYDNINELISKMEYMDELIRVQVI